MDNLGPQNWIEISWIGTQELEDRLGSAQCSCWIEASRHIVWLLVEILEENPQSYNEFLFCRCCKWFGRNPSHFLFAVVLGTEVPCLHLIHNSNIFSSNLRRPLMGVCDVRM